MNRAILFYILIGITVSSKAASDKSQEKNNNTKTTVANLDAKDKRQIDNGQIGLYPQFQQQQQISLDDQQGADSIYSSDPNQFVIRAVNGNRRAQYNIHNVQEQEITSPYAYQEVGPRQQANRNAQKFKQQSGPQFQPGAAYQQRIIPEEQLLKLLEDELAAKGIHVHHQQPLSKQQDKKLINLKYQQAIEKSKSGLGNYRQAAAQQKPDNIEYVYVPQQVYQQSQQQQAQPQLIQQQQQQQQQAQQHHHSIPQGHAQANLEYHRNIPNHPLAASTLEKEIEKLFASNKPNAARYEQLQNPYKVSKVQEKNYTPAPVAPSEKEYSFLPSLAQFSGFKQEPEPVFHESEHSSREYLPKNPEKQGHGQYLSEKQNIKPLAGPYQFEQPKQQPLYQHYFAYQTTKAPPRKQHHQQHHQVQQTQFIPIPNPETKNLAMKIIEAPKLHAGNGPTAPQAQLYYSKQKSQQSEEAADDEKLRYNGPQPSRSTIYVAQGTGVAQHQQSPPTRHHQNHSHKSQNENSKKVRLPPPDGKPITQEEFQALVDAGYPVQAVPVPVPVPYEEYVKTHPEYAQQQQPQQQQQQQQHQHQHQQNQQGPQQASESQQYTSSIRYGPNITHLKPIQNKHSH